MTRDRASAYSSTVSSILPNAIQVADKFHLLKNFSDCVYSVIRIEYRNLAISMNENSLQTEPLPLKIPKENGKVPLNAKGERNEYIKYRFEKVKTMLKDGAGLKTVARSLQISRNAVRRYAKVDVLSSKSIYHKYDYNEYLEIISIGFSEGISFAKIYARMKTAEFKGSVSAFYGQFKDHPMRKTPSVYKAINIKLRLLSPRKISRYLAFKPFPK